jgi:diguanylate cyclase (GGDEF)-like protein/PAS domain S-box-containing protein
MLGKLTARAVIVYGFLTVIMILIAITAIGLARIHNLTSGLDKIVKERDVQVMLMHTMRQSARERSILLQSMMITHDPFLFDDYAMEMSRAAGKYFQTRAKLLQQELSTAEQALLEEQRAQTAITGSTQDQIIELLNNAQFDEAERQLRDIALPGQRIAMNIMDQFITLKRQQNITGLERTTRDINFTYTLMIALSTFGVIFSLSIAYFVSNRINIEIGRRLASENHLRHSELRERTIRENIIDGVLTLDLNGLILSCNRACKSIFGCKPEEMVGKSAHMLLPSAFSEQHSINLARHLSVWEKKMLGTGHEVTGRRKDHSEFPAELDVSRVELDGEASYIVVVRDITNKKLAEIQLQQFNRELEEKVEQRTAELATTNDKLRVEIADRTRAQQELTHRASHDNLTELPNRAFFTEQLTNALFHAERRNNLLALLFMDLDGFKEVNDTHGHEAGDKLLIEVGKRMKAAIRREDIVARMGGDEFTVLLGELSQQNDAEVIARKIIDAVNQPIACNGLSCHVGISIGIAYYPQNGSTSDILIRHADDAMYEAKATGKNRYHGCNHVVPALAHMT